MAHRDKKDRAKRESTPGGATGGAGLPPESPSSDQGGVVGGGKVRRHKAETRATDARRAQADDRSAPEWLSEYRVGPDGRVRPDALVMAMSEDSFPCSDPPSFTPGPIGAPTR
jgi:hypothetical protein